MVDIAMCNRGDCGKRLTCFRYLADPDYYQAYLGNRDVDVDNGCEMYWQCKNGKELKLMNKWNR